MLCSYNFKAIIIRLYPATTTQNESIVDGTCRPGVKLWLLDIVKVVMKQVPISVPSVYEITEVFKMLLRE